MIYAKCIKETYTWEGDNEQHRFHEKVVKGHVYGFNKIGNIYWIVPEAACAKDFKDDNGFIDGVAHGLEKKYFDEMFKIV